MENSTLENIENKTEIVNEFVKINYDNAERPTVSGRELHDALGIETAYKDWFPRMCEYGFIEGIDFNSLKFERVQTEGNRNVKRTINDHQLTISMAKEICMIQRTQKGRIFRRYFIQCEEILKKMLEERHNTAIERAKGIGIRTALTDVIKASSENERMHGHAYSLYTDLIYRALFGYTAKQLREILGVTKKENLRDYLNESEIAAIAKYEDVAKSLMNAGWDYDEIKTFLMNKNNFKVTFENRFEIENKRSE